MRSTPKGLKSASLPTLAPINHFWRVLGTQKILTFPSDFWPFLMALTHDFLGGHILNLKKMAILRGPVAQRSNTQFWSVMRGFVALGELYKLVESDRKMSP